MPQVETIRNWVEEALGEKIFPVPPFGIQVLVKGENVEGVKVYLLLDRGLKFNPENGDIMLGRKILFPNGILGKMEGIYIQMRLARYIVPGIEIIRR